MNSSTYLQNSWNFFTNHITWRTLIGVVIVSCFVYLFIKSVNKFRKATLPPGPKGLPVFGNLFQLSGDVLSQFDTWAKQHGDLVHINVVGYNILILNSHKVCNDIMEQRAAIYSERPRMIVASEYLTGGFLIAFMGINDLWRRMRRASHECFNNTIARNYYPTQQLEAVLLVEGLLNDSKNFVDELKRYGQSMMHGLVYKGGIIADSKDPNITYVNNFIGRLVRAAFPGAHYVEFFPFMRNLPASISKWKRESILSFRRDNEYFGSMYRKVKEQTRNGDERHSFAGTLVRDSKKFQLSEDESTWLAATMYTAAGDVISTVMAWFILAMVRYPAAAKAAQEELDRVIGRDRIPTFDDRDSLPYITACVRETLRWRTLDPIGIPHSSAEDDWYEDYFIPKGTIVIPNVRAMNKDIRVYGPDADDFKPERHLDGDGNLCAAPFGTHDEGHVTYGFGRRICVGRYVSNNALFINIACLLWACNIVPVKDVHGNPVIPDTETFVHDGIVLRPVPFRCEFTERFPGAATFVSDTKQMLSD